MKDIVSKTIGQDTYTFTQFGTTQSWKVLVKLGKILGPAVGDFLSKWEKGSKILDQDVAKIAGPLIAQLMDRIDPDTSADLIKEILNSVMVGGKRIDDALFEVHFRQKIPLMFKVLAAALEVQYGNFYDALSELDALKNSTTTSEKQT